MSEVINLNPLPVAPPGNVNVTWQKGAQTGTDPASGYPIFPVSGYVPTGAGALVIGYSINDGAPGTNVGPMLPAPRSSSLSSVVVVTKTSDGTVPFQFDILQNGTSIFMGTLPTVAAGTASGTLSTFTSLTTVPLNVTKGDIFSINVIQGSVSWMCTVQAES